MLEYDPIAYQCMEEWYENRVEEQRKNRRLEDLKFYCEFMKPRSKFIFKCNNDK
jgi:hypothetical protein